ncbi:MAG: hypothetical protein JWM36_1911 [Hyphomicrobiales bacterium]|nr:hypothetical protein [Hyphomicrobiales bacterium]
MFRDTKLAVGMLVGFIIGVLWGVVDGVSPGEAFLYGSIATFCTLITYPLWRSRK